MKTAFPFLFIVLVAALALAACTGPSSSQRVCPESANVSCLTPLVCEPDAVRGCEVCVCEGDPMDPDYVEDPFEGDQWDGEADPWSP